MRSEMFWQDLSEQQGSGLTQVQGRRRHPNAGILRFRTARLRWDVSITVSPVVGLPPCERTHGIVFTRGDVYLSRWVGRGSEWNSLSRFYPPRPFV